MPLAYHSVVSACIHQSQSTSRLAQAPANEESIAPRSVLASDRQDLDFFACSLRFIPRWRQSKFLVTIFSTLSRQDHLTSSARLPVADMYAGRRKPTSILHSMTRRPFHDETSDRRH
ncbi:hypothetical protein MRB53_040090 [Persea americana]|nr:hypothetical protein MRB53_040090 [Persea americana]